ncbi:hypothetical protein [Conexibacter woesei]|uniref:hypothetical protein n=1 Tax=Conexibacter woesei TaxID=191495 RepID=UPI00040999EA|nr:hypothetical protein [Conexibacter woesei]
MTDTTIADDTTTTATRTKSRLSRERLRQFPWELPVVLLAQLLFLGNAVKTYFVDDDLLNRSVSGALSNTGISYWGGVHALIESWWHDAGRFYPISFYQGPPQLMYIHDYRVYKVLLLAWMVGAGICVWLLLRELGVSRPAASLALLLTSVAVQFRPQDGVLAYTGLEQIILGEMALSLLFFSRFLRLGRKRYMVLSVLLFIISSLTYETSYVFGPLYAIIALQRRGWRIWPWPRLWAVVRPLIPIVLASLVFIAIGSYGRAHATVGSTGPYAPSWNKHEIVYTFVDQFVAAVPLTYAWLDPMGMYGSFSRSIVHGVSWKDIGIGLVFALVALAMLRRIRVRDDWNPWAVALLGLGLWALSAFPIALATRYQIEIVAGLAHIPVVLEFFGFGMVAVGVAVGIGRRVPPPARTAAAAVLAVAIGVVAAFGHRANAIFVASDLPARVVGTTSELAGRTIVRDHVATGSVLYADSGVAGNNAEFYRIYSGHKLDVEPTDPAKADAVADHAKPCVPGRPGTWYLREGLLTPRTGLAILTCAGGPGGYVVLRSMPRDRATVSVLSRATDPRHAPTGVFGLVSTTDLNRVPGAIDPYSTAILPVGDQAVMADWTAGCWKTTPASPTAPAARFCQDGAELTVIPTAGEPARANVQIPLMGTGPKGRTLVVTGPGVNVRQSAKATQPFAVDVPAQGLRLRVRVEGARRLPGVPGGLDAQFAVQPAIPVT